MPVSGKYDFKGIKSTGRLGLRAAFGTTPALAWLNKFPALTDFILECATNWLANKGLILLNTGAYYVNGELDQKALDKAIENGLKAIESNAGKLTPEQMKEIDDAVIKAADKALPYGRKPTKP